MTARDARSAGKEGAAPQVDPFDQIRKALEDMPFTFRYRYRCGPGCASAGHHLTFLDWEIGEVYRSWRSRYPDPAVLMDKIRYKWQEQIPADERDLVLFAGDQNSRRNMWCVFGTWWPPATRQTELLLGL